MSPAMSDRNPLNEFHPVIRAWFSATFREPSPPQLQGWPPIMRGENTLLLAPTGSGKTMAAFLWAINHLFERHGQGDTSGGVGILYISPLKALNNDVGRNLQSPLEEIQQRARSSGLDIRPIRTAVRTGDTPQAERARMIRNPPEILITTPESLYLMLTAKRARGMFKTVQYVIVDEIHSICGTKRGVHLSLSLERLARVAEQEFVRIGLSATQRPLEEIARYLGGQSSSGPRPVTIVDAGRKKEMDVRVIAPVPDFTTLPEDSVWPAAVRHLLELIRLHRTTLVFVNNRRLAERIATQLNDLIAESGRALGLHHVPQAGKEARNEADAREAAEDGPVKAYHGSMSREAREAMESALKNGELNALVATSALELGIDIGSIDLVVQLQSPKGIARGLQRIGRSGHLITATSKGRIIPSFREDLVEAAVAAKAMLQHDVEETRIPANCLDVLAQQIVAMVSVEEQEVDELFELVRQSFCFRSLPRTLFDSVLRMLSGKYPIGARQELRPRISWDIRNNMLRALPGTARQAVTGSGTITDRGYYGVYLEDGETKIGEIDEEFVFESRTGDTFILGSDTWRISSIDADRLRVTSAPGEPARMPFWRGEGLGRTFELSRLVGAFRRELESRCQDPSCLAWIQTEFPVDHESAWIMLEYIRDQIQRAGSVPHDRRLLIESFRDEIGDPRVVVHSCFGRRVNGLLGLYLARVVRERSGVEPQMLYNDDGILLRSPDADDLPTDLFDGLSVSEGIEPILREMPGSALFGGQFRQNAVRSLLIPRTPGKRVPLWLQRLKAKDLLEVVREYHDFPIVIETIREVLYDVLDLEHYRQILKEIEDGTIAVESVRTEVPSPFAAGLMMDFVSVYLYEWDRPRGSGPDQLPVERALLDDLLGQGGQGPPLHEEAVALVDAQLQHTADGYRARSAEELHELLLRIGDLTPDEIRSRCDGESEQFIETLLSDGRAVRLHLAGAERIAAGDHAATYGKPGSDSLPFILEMMLHSHGILSPDQVSERYGIVASEIGSRLQALESTGEVIRLPGPEHDTEKARWSYRPHLERIRRTGLTLLRREIRPVPLSRFTLFLLHWQHLLRTGTVSLEECLGQLYGLPLPGEIWERDILARRVKGYDRDDLSTLTRSGQIVWKGNPGGKIAVLPRGEGAVFAASPPAEDQSQRTAAAETIVGYLRSNGASFLSDIRSGTGLSLKALNRTIADLFWKGVVTNDHVAEVFAVRRIQQTQAPEDQRIEIVSPRHNPRRSVLMRDARQALKSVPGWEGRWSLLSTPAVMGSPGSLQEQAERQARQLLDRYGVVARELVRREEFVPWGLLARAYQKMELRGEIRRGYFVEGLSGMQFAHRAAAELIRSTTFRPSQEGPLLINACDPANPYGPGLALDWDRPEMTRLVRHPANHIMFAGGLPVMVFENLGTRIWTPGSIDDALFLACLRCFTGSGWPGQNTRPFSEIHCRYINGARPGGGPYEDLLRSAGFYRDRDQTMRWSRYQ